jgi:hypothetical protein
VGGPTTGTRRQISRPVREPNTGAGVPGRIGLARPIVEAGFIAPIDVDAQRHASHAPQAPRPDASRWSLIASSSIGSRRARGGRDLGLAADLAGDGVDRVGVEVLADVLGQINGQLQGIDKGYAEVLALSPMLASLVQHEATPRGRRPGAPSSAGGTRNGVLGSCSQRSVVFPGRHR